MFVDESAMVVLAVTIAVDGDGGRGAQGGPAGGMA